MHFSWAEDERERDAWVSYVRGIEGVRPSSVRYLDLDYRRDEFAPDVLGPREIEDEAEWVRPSWAFPGGHSVDFGIELIERSGRVWSVGWIPPGLMEGLAVYDEPMLPGVLSEGAAVAVWDVTEQAPWRTLVGQPIESVQVAYEPWSDSGCWWCPRLELEFSGTSVELLLAQGAEDGALTPSADNIVIRSRNR